MNYPALRFFWLIPLPLLLFCGLVSAVESAKTLSITSDTRFLRSFDVKADDESLSLALRRWANEHQHRLIWDAGKDFQVKETTYQAADLIAAIEQVMTDTERSSYPLHACAYRNRVIRVLHISQPCERR